MERDSKSPKLAAALLAVTAASLVFIALPQTRAFVQHQWQRFTPRSGKGVKDLQLALPLDHHFSAHGQVHKAADVDEASTAAGYTPHLPLLGSLPELGVIDPISLTQTFDSLMPVTLQAEFGPAVIAGYPGEVQIIQCRPPKVSILPDSDLERLIEAALRSIGVPAAEASRIGRDFLAQPALILLIPPGQAAHMTEITLRHGPALFIEERNGQSQPSSYTLLFHTSNRLYSLTAPNQHLAIRAANLLE